MVLNQQEWNGNGDKYLDYSKEYVSVLDTRIVCPVMHY